jgi:hypothetical protein
MLYSNEIGVAINRVKNYEFKQISQFINDTRTGVRIPHTKYSIDADSFGKIVPLIQSMCKVLELNAKDINIYFDADINGNVAYTVEDTSDWEIEEVSDIEYYNTREIPENNVLSCVISGNILNSIVFNAEQRELQSMVISRCLAIKTQSGINGILDSQEALKDVIVDMLANSEYPCDEIIDSQDNLFNSEYKLISRDINDVGEGALQFQFGGDDYYLANPEQYQIVYALIGLYYKTSGGMSISLRVNLDKDMIDFYKNKLDIIDPVKLEAVQVFLGYINSRIKN